MRLGIWSRSEGMGDEMGEEENEDGQDKVRWYDPDLSGVAWSGFTDVIVMRGRDGQVYRIEERDDGTWGFPEFVNGMRLIGSAPKYQAFDPPGGPFVAVGRVLRTAQGRRLVVQAIMIDARDHLYVVLAEG
jgi:hypothetical protein